MSGQTAMDLGCEDKPQEDHTIRPRFLAKAIIDVVASMILKVPKQFRTTVITMVYMALAKAYEKGDMAHQNRDSKGAIKR